MVHLLQEQNFWYTNKFSFTSYATITPHSDSRSEFPTYMTSHIEYILAYKIIATCIEHATMHWAITMCVMYEHKAG